MDNRGNLCGLHPCNIELIKSEGQRAVAVVWRGSSPEIYPHAAGAGTEFFVDIERPFGLWTVGALYDLTFTERRGRENLLLEPKKRKALLNFLDKFCERNIHPYWRCVIWYLTPNLLFTSLRILEKSVADFENITQEASSKEGFIALTALV